MLACLELTPALPAPYAANLHNLKTFAPSTNPDGLGMVILSRLALTIGANEEVILLAGFGEQLAELSSLASSDGTTCGFS